MVYYSKALAVWIALLSGPAAYAGVIAFSGLITQSTQDGTGPAVNNSALNGIADGDPYTVELTFPGQISVPGAWSPLLGAVVVFSDSSNSEAAFSSASVTVSADSNPTLYDVNVFACLSTGSGCYVGNSLSANFSVGVSSFGSPAEVAMPIPGLYPSLDLLEDDGSTDIQAAVTAFSSTTGSGPEPPSIPEPRPAAALSLGFCLLFLRCIVPRSRP